MHDFMKFLAEDREARNVIQNAFETCNNEDCKSCIEDTLNYYYMKWLFGILKEPKMVARAVEECMGGRNG